MRCQSCGKEYNESSRFCPFCGAKKPQAEADGERVVCARCGTEYNPVAYFCPECGESWSSEVVDSTLGSEGGTAAPMPGERISLEKLHRERAIYLILAVVPYLIGLVLLFTLKPPLGTDVMLIVLVLIAYATIRLSRVLRFETSETVVAILLVLLIYVGSFIYMLYMFSKVEKEVKAGGGPPARPQKQKDNTQNLAKASGDEVSRAISASGPAPAPVPVASMGQVFVWQGPAQKARRAPSPGFEKVKVFFRKAWGVAWYWRATAAGVVVLAIVGIILAFALKGPEPPQYFDLGKKSLNGVELTELALVKDEGAKYYHLKGELEVKETGEVTITVSMNTTKGTHKEVVYEDVEEGKGTEEIGWTFLAIKGKVLSSKLADITFEPVN